MTLTVISLFCASKSGRICRSASFRLLAAATVRVSGAACADDAVQTGVVTTVRNNKPLNSKFRPVIKYLLVIVRGFIICLEIKLVLYVDPVFNEIAPESGLELKRIPIRGTPAASHCEVGVVDDKPVVVGPVEAIVDGGAELLGQIILLLGRRIQHPITYGEFELARNDVFPHLHIPAPGLAKIHRRACELSCWNSVLVERLGSGVFVPYPLVPIVAFRLKGPALIFPNEVYFIGLKIVDTSTAVSYTHLTLPTSDLV